jgi:AraC-like DNA-binding protein
VENFSAGKVSVATCSDFDSLIAVFYLDKTGRFKETVREICEGIVTLLGESYGIIVQGMISSPVCSPEQLSSAYRETQKLMNFTRSVDSYAKLVSQEELSSSGGSILNGNYLKQYQILINTLLVGKYSLVPSMVSTILREHVSPLSKNYALAHSRLYSIASILSEDILISGVFGADSRTAAEKIRDADSVSKLNAVVSDVYGKMAAKQPFIAKDDPVNRAVAYIHNNIGDPNLNVSAVCESVGVSVQHLTRLFHNKLDMAIAEYINTYRIRVAKELLADKKLTIKQIAKKVGYISSETLTRNFRKLEGITPTECRHMLL